MVSDGVIPLINKGIITNQYKKKYRNKTVTSFLLGSRKLYDFIDDNPSVVALNIDYINDTSVMLRFRLFHYHSRHIPIHL